MQTKILNVLLFCVLSIVACNNGASTQSEEKEQARPEEVTVTESNFGVTEKGAAKLYTLNNTNGMEVEVSNYGGIITRVLAPDRDGKLEDVVLGFDQLEDYQNDHPYFGSAIGRYGNRIAKGKFLIGNEQYTLATNNGPNSLHGGPKGFHKQLWSAKTIKADGQAGIELTRTSSDMEEGFPGNLRVIIRYWLSTNNELIMEYEATTDKPTIVNLTNHSYFNLNGGGEGDILGHELRIKANAFTPVDESLIPTGELRPVEGTPFDFRAPTAIGSRIDVDNEQLKFGLGYDHNWVLDRTSDGMELVASLYEPNSGRFMEILTVEPGLQFYSGNFLDSTNTGKKGKVYAYRTGLCLETQHYPDSPNQENFPSTRLNPGETYQTKTIYRFTTK